MKFLMDWLSHGRTLGATCLFGVLGCSAFAQTVLPGDDGSAATPINPARLAVQEAANPRALKLVKRPPAWKLKVPENLPVEPEMANASAARAYKVLTSDGGMAESAAIAEAEGAQPSPPPSASFQALPDNGTVAPPDPYGAVGANHVMAVTAGEIRIQSRSGSEVNRMSLEGFWSGVGSNVVDPRVLYDPYSQRW